MTVLAALVLPFAMMRAGASAEDETRREPTAENPRRAAAAESKTTESKATWENQRQSTVAADEKKPDWSDPIGGLEFRLTAPRTVFQAWELPTLAIEVRNTADKAVTAQAVEAMFQSGRSSGLRFLFKDQHKRSGHGNWWVVPDMRLDRQKFVGLKPGETMTQTVTMAATLTIALTRDEKNPLLGTYGLDAGRYTIGLGMLRAPSAGELKANSKWSEFDWCSQGPQLTADLKANSVTLTVLPPGVQDRKGLKRFLKPYVAGEAPILAGFVPNKTTLVEGEPLLATFMVENPGDEPFTFEFGEDFTIDVIGPDGKHVKALPQQFTGDGGNITYPRTAEGRDATVATLDLLTYRAIAGPGKFQVTCKFVLTPFPLERKKENFNVPVETTYELTILPRDPANVQRVLDEYFDQAKKTGAWALEERVAAISSFGRESAVAGLATMGMEGDVEHRVAAAKGLGKIATPSAMEALLRIQTSETHRSSRDKPKGRGAAGRGAAGRAGDE
jgi:hypothetical protein